MRDFLFLMGAILLTALAYWWAKGFGSWSVCLIRDQACSERAIAGGIFSGRVSAAVVASIASIVWWFFIRKRSGR
ncbi:hypothetical protein WBP06_08590 [Novosphingobium sp. BL-8H]|uniref:hypothetical protein n=1 Tax=Novosphingobium sp. BL-8H TaxID=3127640 RepID=UPI003757021B